MIEREHVEGGRALGRPRPPASPRELSTAGWARLPSLDTSSGPSFPWTHPTPTLPGSTWNILFVLGTFLPQILALKPGGSREATARTASSSGTFLPSFPPVRGSFLPTNMDATWPTSSPSRSTLAGRAPGRPSKSEVLSPLRIGPRSSLHWVRRGRAGEAPTGQACLLGPRPHLFGPFQPVTSSRPTACCCRDPEPQG